MEKSTLVETDRLLIPRPLCVNKADPGLVEVKLLPDSPARNKLPASLRLLLLMMVSLIIVRWEGLKIVKKVKLEKSMQSEQGTRCVMCNVTIASKLDAISHDLSHIGAKHDALQKLLRWLPFI